jgi:hypothetical protein
MHDMPCCCCCVITCRPTFTEIVAELQRLAKSEAPSSALAERLQCAIAECAVETQEAAAAGGAGSSSGKSESKKLEGLYGKWSLSWRRVFKPGDEKAGGIGAGTALNGSPNSSIRGAGGVGSSSSSSAGFSGVSSVSGVSGLVDADVAAAAAAVVAAEPAAAGGGKPAWMR